VDSPCPINPAESSRQKPERHEKWRRKDTDWNTFLPAFCQGMSIIQTQQFAHPGKASVKESNLL
jgi:hypothetical protein